MRKGDSNCARSEGWGWILQLGKVRAKIKRQGGEGRGPRAGELFTLENSRGILDLTTPAGLGWAILNK